MSHLQYFDYPNWGTRTTKEANLSQAVRYSPSSGDIVEISGQGGWDRETEIIPSDIALEIDQAFANVDHILKVSGASGGWSNVSSTRIYLVAVHDPADAQGDDRKEWNRSMVECLRNVKKWCPDHAPVATVVEVKRLYSTMRVEIEVRAHIPGEH